MGKFNTWYEELSSINEDDKMHNFGRNPADGDWYEIEVRAYDALPADLTESCKKLIETYATHLGYDTVEGSGQLGYYPNKTQLQKFINWVDDHELEYADKGQYLAVVVEKVEPFPEVRGAVNELNSKEIYNNKDKPEVKNHLAEFFKKYNTRDQYYRAQSIKHATEWNDEVKTWKTKYPKDYDTINANRKATWDKLPDDLKSDELYQVKYKPFED